MPAMNVRSTKFGPRWGMYNTQINRIITFETCRCHYQQGWPYGMRRTITHDREVVQLGGIQLFRHQKGVARIGIPRTHM